MNPQQVQQMINQSMAKLSQANRFNISSIPRHIHNDIDSPFTFQPVKTYVGSIGADGTIGILPIGWSVTVESTGSYLITHNLSTAIYSVVASANFSYAVPVLQPLQNSFEVIMEINGNPTNTAFSFIMTVINNKATKTTQYGGDFTSG